METINNGLEFILTSGEEKQQEGKTFTQLRGGFEGNQSVMISDLQIAELLGYKKGARQVRSQFERNKENFVVGEHFYDLKDKILGAPQSDTYLETLESLGYTKQALLQAKNIYIFSRAGFLLLLKFVDGEKSIKLYKEFIESYFKMAHELETTNKKLELVTDTLEQTVEALEKQALDTKKQLAYMQVDLAYEPDPEERARIHERLQELTELSIEANNALERKKTTDLLLQEYDAQLTFAKTIENNATDTFDIGDFAKVLNIKGMGRNNIMKWLRDEKILMNSSNKNMPYQQHIGNHFKVIYVNTKSNMTVPKTLLTGKGVIYLVNRLIKSGKLSSDVTGKEVLSLLENQACNSDSNGEQNGE